AWGFVIVGSMLIYSVLESVTIAADQALGHAADPASALASGTIAPVFVVLAVIGMIPAAIFLRHLDRIPPAGSGADHAEKDQPRQASPPPAATRPPAKGARSHETRAYRLRLEAAKETGRVRHERTSARTCQR